MEEVEGGRRVAVIRERGPRNILQPWGEGVVLARTMIDLTAVLGCLMITVRQDRGEEEREKKKEDRGRRTKTTIEEED